MSTCVALGHPPIFFLIMNISLFCHLVVTVPPLPSFLPFLIGRETLPPEVSVGVPSKREKEEESLWLVLNPGLGGGRRMPHHGERAGG